MAEVGELVADFSEHGDDFLFRKTRGVSWLAERL
jgi:hypothetical protein